MAIADRNNLATVQTVGGAYYVDHLWYPEAPGPGDLDVYLVSGPSPAIPQGPGPFPATPEGMKAALELITERVTDAWRDEIAAEESEAASSR